jgi:RimJ/RimL family protein N-acetyltransferase
MAPTSLRTQRLLLRQWQDGDLEPFAALNADPQVMEFFPDVLDRATSDVFVARQRALLRERGWGLWAVEVLDSGAFAGFVGLAAVPPELPASGGVEVGWRLAHSCWGQGYAPEAARAVVAHGFDVLGLDEIVSFTTERNVRSRRVMEKVGLTHDPSRDFVHPRTPGWWGAPHVLYAASRSRWEARQARHPAF